MLTPENFQVYMKHLKESNSLYSWSIFAKSSFSKASNNFQLLWPVAQLCGQVRTDWNQCFVIDCSLSHQQNGGGRDEFNLHTKSVRSVWFVGRSNKMVLWPGCGGRDEFNLHTKSVRSVWFVVKRRGCYCNLSGGVALIVWFTTNGMCVKNNTIIL